ncbi:hypothetical protein [Alteromonas mediterranea]|uniref:Uncharacterized protein n=1 Tax=Alteromonas mediterranea TaxID=314275 RepID=A0AAC8XKN1_9ALTE|nr:hypothetical protein [Alteromonas mediterranea]AFV85991.1 hypothetical protein amad1_12455 [Alteromonas mediterranea DE1]AGP98002.1 hypothetical protein I635_12435 [Alteromonas mediterranea UM7]AGQ02261.1 hypothetical protein I636_12070 [Alteromonas mediterranea UM4b]AMJ79009.1 hypothetical protein AV942_12250 [Alteromonas mediterranea]AMJ83155.1 hypothetical protein AV941_12275 [Alteromonas mediterranea]
MSQVANFATFTSPELVNLNYSYEPITEYIELLNYLYQSAETDIQKHTCSKYKNILNDYLGGREPQEEELKSILEQKKHFGPDKGSFYVAAKRLYKLIKSCIEVKIVLQNCLNEILNSINGNIVILCRKLEDQNFLESIICDDSKERVGYVFPRQLRNHYITCTLVIIAPSYWFKELLAYPCSHTTLVVQPENLPSSVVTNDVFDGVGGERLWTSKKNNPNVQNRRLLLPPPPNYEREETKQNSLSELVIELRRMQPTIFTREIKSLTGQVALIEVNRKYLVVDEYGVLKLRPFLDDDELDGCKYIVNEIDHSEMSDDDVNLELRKQMESWKSSLREYNRPFELPRILTSLGAKHAKDYNIKNWKKKDTIRPKDDDDFRALLKFADIPEVEYPFFFNLAKNIRSNCISMGHRKSEVSREIIAKELRKCLQQQDTLPSSFNVGKIKASILAVG